MQSTTRFIRAILIAATTAATALPAAAAELTVRFGEREPGNMLAPESASCVATRDGKSRPGRNESPSLSWSKGPAGTRSYALTMVDPTVPVDRSDFNKPGTMILHDVARMEFVHWVLADIPAGVTHLAESADGDGVSKEGLALKKTIHGRRGQNGAGDGTLKNGPHGGYLGPCPPWNDERIHHYVVTIYALDVAELPLPPIFSRADLLAAAKGHILATGTTAIDYTVNEGSRK
ncbi:YbhB/YbcL family Raf kinase inhibitor-like protein [Rhizobium tubonense]|uniref:YbhB/YbcL family Raf kinase inhibitor-like protein n=1 Tax=Rhizobium tubonense TaxID=484088 RepID=A0A2W4D542_9HYPH|nr:YbhB/YbcL family Raf kinase inhibitor-like protein [Rhizobium tubonense]PZM17165.1 YbhB/YbcL family Raf kinase inhibitor-like protein [Rhizobium tubonense]